jgi:hypothetical protein
MADINQNQESDFKEAMKDIRDSEQYQEQTGLTKRKRSLIEWLLKIKKVN